MNAYSLARTGYGAASTPIRTPRGLEYEAFVRVTRRLKQAQTSPKRHFSEFAEALHENRRLWNLLAAQVAEKDNALPADLRARIFYLAEFTAAHSRKVLDGSSSALPLIEINVAIMRGLKQERA